ncbi:MAG: alpha/beta fold hydrolase [Cyanobacteria bacterium P01_A01_bin.37]
MLTQIKEKIELTGQPDRRFMPPWFARNGWGMTLYNAWRLEQYRSSCDNSVPSSSSDEISSTGGTVSTIDHIFMGDRHVPIFGQITSPARPEESDFWTSVSKSTGTIIATYGIVGSLDQQKALHILRDKARITGYTVIGIDWRAHGKTATLSPALTSDGLYEGRDFVHVAAQAKAMGCPPPYWFMGYSLGGQLALWGLHPDSLTLATELGLSPSDIGGAAVICPNLDSNRSLDFLVSSIPGQILQRSITRKLTILAQHIHDQHPGTLSDEAIARANSIRHFDEEFIIHRLGFDSVEDYYTASSPLPWLSDVTKPVFILYAADDPMFHPGIVPDLAAIAQQNSLIDLWLTEYGGHVGYFSDSACQARWGDRDPWWAWNRVIDWLKIQPH